MRLAFSNIAWDTSEDEVIADLLGQHGIDAVDVAPGKYFPAPGRADPAEISRVREWWAKRGIEITGVQALLFGTTGLNVFGTPDSQTAMLAHLDAVCRIAAGLGANRLVFGSPRNRDRSGLADGEADATAVAFFRRLGNVAGAHGVVVCLEPNPERYGCNFMTNTAQAATIVARVDHSAIRLQLDLSTMTINREDPASTVAACAKLVAHVHVSEPDLVTLGDGNTDHRLLGEVLRRELPQHVAAIEMLAAQNEAHPSAVARALKTAIRHYRETDRTTDC